MTSGTREWAEHNRNCIDGCENDCIYCYAKGMAIRFKRRTKGNWHEMKRNSAALPSKVPKEIKMVNLSIDKILVQEAKDRFRINLSAFCERELLRKVRHLRRQEQKNNDGQEVPASSIMGR